MPSCCSTGKVQEAGQTQPLALLQSKSIHMGAHFCPPVRVDALTFLLSNSSAFCVSPMKRSMMLPSRQTHAHTQGKRDKTGSGEGLGAQHPNRHINATIP